MAGSVSAATLGNCLPGKVSTWNLLGVCQLAGCSSWPWRLRPQGRSSRRTIHTTVLPLGSLKVIFSPSDNPGLRMRDQEHDLLVHKTYSCGLMAVPRLGETQPQALPGDHMHFRDNKVHKSNTETCQWPSALMSPCQDSVHGPFGGFTLS